MSSSHRVKLEKQFDALLEKITRLRAEQPPAAADTEERWMEIAAEVDDLLQITDDLVEATPTTGRAR